MHPKQMRDTVIPILPSSVYCMETIILACWPANPRAAIEWLRETQQRSDSHYSCRNPDASEYGGGHPQKGGRRYRHHLRWGAGYGRLRLPVLWPPAFGA